MIVQQSLQFQFCGIPPIKSIHLLICHPPCNIEGDTHHIVNYRTIVKSFTLASNISESNITIQIHQSCWISEALSVCPGHICKF